MTVFGTFLFCHVHCGEMMSDLQRLFSLVSPGQYLKLGKLFDQRGPVENDASARPPNLSLASCDLDL